MSPLLTDLYQLTMAAGYWKHDWQDRRAVFHLFFRRAPFGEKAALAAGIQPALDFLTQLKFSEDDLAYLGTLAGPDGQPIFESAFLDYLRDLAWSLDVAAVPEGTLVLPHEPLLRIEGPLLQCQLVETALLNIVNFQTLIATKAARVCSAAEGDPVLEFGLRRAQGPDGGLSASRAAFLGGCAATSNVLAGKEFGIPVKGTHAHSWVMSYPDELAAFTAYAKALPNNVTCLVDTYDTIQGVKNAIKVGQSLREKGQDLQGIRLDSGDLADLSQKARALLDDAGFSATKIVASNDLDEHKIGKLKAAGAKIDVWGVGTQLVTAADQPALGGVYKLGAIQNDDGTWDHKVKLSNDPIKVSNPGILQVARQTDPETGAIADVLYDEATTPCPVDHQPVLLLFLKSHQPTEAKNPSLTETRLAAQTAWQNYRQNPTPNFQLHPDLETTKMDLLRSHGY